MSFFLTNPYFFATIPTYFYNYDPYLDNNTVLLIKGDNVTTGAQNNVFLDSSSNNFTITRNGTPTQGSFSPYGNSWSIYFNGSGDYLSRAFSSISDGMYLGGMAGSTHNIEAWVYMNSTTGRRIVYNCSATNAGNFGEATLSVDNGIVNFSVRATTGGVTTTISGGSISANTWNHIAVTVNNLSCKLFLNGTQVGLTTTITLATFTPVGAAIGRYSNGFTSGVTDFGGYISNLRIVKGTALYTSDFTPPTSPLTGVSGTSFLTCQSNHFKDNSSSNFTITANGTPSVQPISPFKPTSEYSITANGGSGYFDGSGDYLTIPANTNFAFGTGNFTIEAWVYPTQSTFGTRLVTNRRPLLGQAGTWSFIFNSTGIQFSEVTTSESLIQGNYSFIPNNWYHICVTRVLNTIRLFVNGNIVGTGTLATNFNNSSYALYIASSPQENYVPGYISNLRIIKGTAAYTSNFTPPTSPLTAVANTSLLCNFTNAGIFDNAAKNNLITIGNARASTAIKKFGTGSLYFDGLGSEVLALSSNNFAFRTGDFTVECWANFRSSLNSQCLFDFRSSSNSFNGFFWGVTNNGHIQVYTGTQLMAVQSNISLSSWNHFALVREGTTMSCYVNGIRFQSITDNSDWTDTDCRIGRSFSMGENAVGYFDEIRITKGIARYTSNFNPPISSFMVS